MESKAIQDLIAKYNEGLADPSEVQLLEQLIEAGKVHLTQLTDLDHLHNQVIQLESMQPDILVGDRFYKMLAAEKQPQKAAPVLLLYQRMAIAAGLLVCGFMLGYLLQSPSGKEEVIQLTEQVSDLKEMMMLSLLEKESATQRLKAVSLTSEMEQVSDKVTDALFVTLNNDENVNVRLAALEALKPYVKSDKVRSGLIAAISKQDSPLVQVALADLMVKIQEKKSVEALRQILEKDDTPKEVKSKISESIEVLI
ncbi:MAG: HEAT repeat domain-containing protein [Cyclobacteriaceae bacterium]|nr:HEAT repeat domain-containing protein [Cyclobacteriaceae bacterium]